MRWALPSRISCLFRVINAKSVVLGMANGTGIVGKGSFYKCLYQVRFKSSYKHAQRRHLGGLGGRRPLRKKKKRKKRKKERKKEKRERKEKKREKRKKGTMNSVKLLHIKCCFFQFFNSPVALKNKKKFRPPQEKVEMTPLSMQLGITQDDAG